MAYSFPSEPADYLNLAKTEHAGLFAGCSAVWEAVAEIPDYLSAQLRPANHGSAVGNAYIGDNVFIGEGATIQPGATILGPAWIGKSAVIGAGCFVRENVILGDGVIAGNSSEFKNCLIFDRAEVPHFNYVGDSIVGYRAHLAAGVILSNYRLDHAAVDIPDPHNPGSRVATGLEKFGAVVGDEVEIGCNAVISPGTLIGRNSILYPGVHWRGVLAANKIVKVRQQQQVVERRQT